MAGNRDGTAGVDESVVLQSYMVTPTRMRMHMEMLEVMYAPSDQLTLMLMAPLLQTSMDHLTPESRARMSPNAPRCGATKRGGLVDVVNRVPIRYVLERGQDPQMTRLFLVRSAANHRPPSRTSWSRR